MPLAQREAILGFLLLSISVPLQYYLATQSQWGGDLHDRETAWNSLTGAVNKAVEWWVDVRDMLDDMAVGGEVGEDGEQPVLVVGLKGANGGNNVSVTEGYFATSTKPRKKRPEEVLYRVGEVVLHKALDIRGVVMGWDATAKAPMIWLNQVYGNNQEMAQQPHYTVICDIRTLDDIESEVHYFPQVRLKSDSDSKVGGVINPMLDVLFKGYSLELGRYIMKPHLKRLYPKD